MSAKSKSALHVIPIRDFSSCAFCDVRRLCLPVSVENRVDLVDELVDCRPHYNKGDYLYRTSDPFRSLYAIKSGSVKTYGVTRDGKEQITGFHFSGELIGLDAISNDIHNCNAVALEKTVVCAIPYQNLEALGESMHGIQREIARLMSKEIRHDEEMLMVIGSMRAEQRVACFLFSLYRRMLPYSEDEAVVMLPMTREEIGNYLGLSLETVSRRMTSLQDEGIIKVENRRIHLRDIEALQALCH